MRKTEPDTQARILSAGKAEFLEKGFKDASLRNIAQSAGVTTGAIYGYYKDKNALFTALVEPAAEHLMNTYIQAHKEFEALPTERKIAEMHTSSDKALLYLLEHIYAHFDSFKLITCCSAGTDYEDYFHRLIAEEIASTRRFIDTINQSGHKSRSISENLNHLLASAYINSVFETVAHDMPLEEAKEYVADLTDFFGAGWDRLLDMG